VNVGERVPDFTLAASNGENLTLSAAVAGKKAVVLTTFPLAFTGGCDIQLCAFNAQISEFEALNVQVIGLSADHKFSSKAFAEKIGLNYLLVADPNRVVSTTLGTLLPDVAGVNNVNCRSAMIIGPDLTLLWKAGETAAVQPNVSEVLGQVKAIAG